MPARKSWPEYLKHENLFSNAIRLRYFIWTMQHYIPQGSRLLEVGFGSGATAALLADMGYRVTAVDINEELVENLNHRYSDWVSQGRLEVRRADMLALPWQHCEFDAAYHQGVLEHFSDKHIIQALQEQARVAKWVIFDVPNHRLRTKHFGDERLLSPNHWRRLIYQSGLEIVNHVGRDFSRWMYFLPFAFFSRESLAKFPWFGRYFGVNSIWICKVKGKHI